MRSAQKIPKATEPVLPLTDEAAGIQPMPIDAPVRLPLTPNQIVSWTRSDIRMLRVDAIINAANERLLGGGGLDGAIHAAAGPALLEACKLLNGCETREVKITPGFDLPARFIILQSAHGATNRERCCHSATFGRWISRCPRVCGR